MRREGFFVFHGAGLQGRQVSLRGGFIEAGSYVVGRAYPEQGKFYFPARETRLWVESGVFGRERSAELSASGGTLPYQWQVNRGFLPPGLRLDRQTGVLSGKPLRPGTYQVTIIVTDSSGPARESLTEQYTIKIAR